VDETEQWENRYRERNREAKEWRRRFIQLAHTVYTAAPQFADALRRAEGMIHPFATLVEIVKFIEICNELRARIKTAIPL